MVIRSVRRYPSLSHVLICADGSVPKSSVLICGNPSLLYVVLVSGVEYPNDRDIPMLIRDPPSNILCDCNMFCDMLVSNMCCDYLACPLFEYVCDYFAKFSSVRIVCIALLRSKAVPPTWSNGQVMTKTECSVVKTWILKQRGRRYPTWGANVPLRRELFLTHGRNKLPLFGVPVDVEDEQNTLNLCPDEVHSGTELPFNLFGAHSRSKLPADHVRSEPVHYVLGLDF